MRLAHLLVAKIGSLLFIFSLDKLLLTGFIEYRSLRKILKQWARNTNIAYKTTSLTKAETTKTTK